MYSSDKSVDHEVEILIPEPVHPDESGQDDMTNGDQVQDDEIDDETEDIDLSPRTNPDRCQIPLFEGHQFYPRQHMIVPTPSFQTL
jgi:hypothetical protein